MDRYELRKLKETIKNVILITVSVPICIIAAFGFFKLIIVSIDLALKLFW